MTFLIKLNALIEVHQSDIAAISIPGVHDRRAASCLLLWILHIGAERNTDGMTRGNRSAATASSMPTKYLPGILLHEVCIISPDNDCPVHLCRLDETCMTAYLWAMKSEPLKSQYFYKGTPRVQSKLMKDQTNDVPMRDQINGGILCNAKDLADLRGCAHEWTHCWWKGIFCQHRCLHHPCWPQTISRMTDWTYLEQKASRCIHE